MELTVIVLLTLLGVASAAVDEKPSSPIKEDPQGRNFGIIRPQYPQYPNNQYPNNQYPNNQYPNNRYPNNQYPNTQYPNNFYPWNSGNSGNPGNMYPGTNYPMYPNQQYYPPTNYPYYPNNYNPNYGWGRPNANRPSYG